MSETPYDHLATNAFWRPAVSARHFSDMENISVPLDVSLQDRIATAGSCFAQHIGRRLAARGARYLDLEPAPSFLSQEDAGKHGFGVYSCRYGNIYTAKQLRQLADEAFGDLVPGEVVWEKNGRFFDALRPSVSPVGHASAEEVVAARAYHLGKVRDLMRTVDVFVFTLGLTEGWELEDGTVFPVCPGTAAGTFDSNKYRFRNYTYPEVMDDLLGFRRRMKEENPTARMLLTVSPVPLTATASGDHVLVASCYSKSTLRAVAGDMARAFEDVMYFPSYEIIASHPMRGTFFNPDLRTVNASGVDFVMKNFFEASARSSWPETAAEDEQAIICDEEKLDAYAPAG